MTMNSIAALAAAGLLTAGVAAASTETRSAAAIPAASLSTLKPAVRGVPSRQAARPDCTLASNAQLPACANPGQSGAVLGEEAARHGGMSGVVLGVLAAGGIGTAVAIAAKNDSNG